MTVMSKSMVKRLTIQCEEPKAPAYPPQVRDVTVPWLKERALMGDWRALACLTRLAVIWSGGRDVADLEKTFNTLLALFVEMRPPPEVLQPASVRPQKGSKP